MKTDPFEIPDFLKREKTSTPVQTIEFEEKKTWWMPDRFEKHTKEEFVEEEDGDEDRVVEKPKVVNYRPSAQAILSSMIGECEEKIDEFIRSYKSDFNMYEWLMIRAASNPQAQGLIRFYTPQLADIMTDDAHEFHPYMSAREFKKYREMLQTWMADLERYTMNKNAGRKPRATKQKSADQILKHFNFKKEDVDLKLVSVNPASIVGATQLWVYNTNNNTLGVYYALDGGLKIHRSAIKNYDPDNSVSKKIRNKIGILATILDASKVQLRKSLDTLSAKAMVLNGQVNQHCILLRVVK